MFKYFKRRRPPMEDDLQWKRTSNGRQPPMEDDPNGRRPPMEDYLQALKVEYLSNHRLDRDRCIFNFFLWVGCCLCLYSQPAIRVCVVKYTRRYIWCMWRSSGDGFQCIMWSPNFLLCWSLAVAIDKDVSCTQSKHCCSTWPWTKQGSLFTHVYTCLHSGLHRLSPPLLNLNSSLEWQCNQLDHHHHHPPRLNFKSTSRQLRKLIFGMQSYFNPTRKRISNFFKDDHTKKGEKER